MNMIKQQKFSPSQQLMMSVLMGLVLISLLSCDDTGSTSTQPTADTINVQQFPTFDSLQQPSETDQLKARLFDNPNDFNTLDRLANLYFESAQYVEAIQTYDKAIAVNPQCADCFNDRGLASFYLGDTASALESFDKAIALEPAYPNPWLSKGFVLVSVGRYQEAVSPLYKVKELDTTGRLTQAAEEYLAKATQGNSQ